MYYICMFIFTYTLIKIRIGSWHTECPTSTKQG